MSDEPKVTPEMLARVLHEARAEELAEKTAKMTEAEKDKALAKMGTSRAALKASLAERRAKYEAEQKKTKPEPTAKVVELSSWRTRILPWAAILTGIGTTGSFATGLAIYQRLATMPGTYAAPPETATASPAALQARELRYDALRMLELGNYQECIWELDDARRLDPEGEHDPALASARRRAEQALTEQKRSP